MWSLHMTVWKDHVRCYVSSKDEKVRSSSSYLLTARCRVLLEKITGFQLVKKFLAFYGTRNRIHKCPSPVPILTQIDPIHPPTSYFLKIYLHIILPFTPGSPKWYLTLRFPHRNPVHASPPYALHAQPISFFSILPHEQYWVRRTDH